MKFDKEDMKNIPIRFRCDQKTFDLLEEAKHLSGIPVSEIIRKGALSEAVHIISMYQRASTRSNKYTQSQSEVPNG